VDIEHREGIILLRPEGSELGAEIAENFKVEGLAAIPPEGGSVALDLAGIEFMDSSGLSAMVAMLKKARIGGGLVLLGIRPAVREILALTRLDTVFPVCESFEAASAQLRGENGEATAKTA